MAKGKKTQSEGISVEAGKESQTAEKKAGKGLKKREVIFLALAFVIMLIIVPYMYYTRRYTSTFIQMQQRLRPDQNLQTNHK